MKLKKRYLATFHFVTAFAVSTIYGQTSNYSFKLLDQSNFQVAGSTNVIKFFCESEQSYNSVVIPVTFQEKSIRFSYNKLRARTKGLDCGGTGINKDMYNSLQADKYPFIDIELQSVQFSRELIQNTWTPATVDVYFTIAGKRRNENFSVQIQMQSDSNYKLKGSHKIYLTDYNIDPPKAMLGMINVDNEIELLFDLAMVATPQ